MPIEEVDGTASVLLGSVVEPEEVGCGGLLVEVDEEDLHALIRERVGQVHCRRRLAHAAFVVADS